jgi:S1-C subfamily serine protease
VFTIKKHLANSEFTGAASPDVGLILLEAKGHPIPALPLASSKELDKLRIGTQLGTLGFPGELQEKYLSIIDRKKKTIPSVLATFKDGWIGRMTDYKSSTARFEDAHYIQHSASLTGGTSGSPMFTKDGKVVAMNNATQEVILQSSSQSGKVEKARFASAAQIAFAIRIDELSSFMIKANF